MRKTYEWRRDCDAAIADARRRPCSFVKVHRPTMSKSLKTVRFTEIDIKALVLNELRAQGRIDRRALVASEFCLGRSGARADLMICAGELIGVEIKSELDSLRRLKRQLSSYREFCDRTILVAASRHLGRPEAKTLRGIEEVWELLPGGRLRTVQNVQPTLDRKPANWASLMTQAELRRVVRTDEPEALRAAFLGAFSTRFGDSSREFWTAIGRRKIRPEDLNRLSRYRDARLFRAAWSEARSVDWAEWLEAAEAALGANAGAPNEQECAA